MPGTAVEWGFRWNDDDQATERWWPQGITTSADASDTEDIDGRRLLVTSWYSKTRRAAATSAAGSPSSTSTPWSTATCCSSCPSATTTGEVELKPLLVHAGGLVWCGPYLHVAGTRRGLFSCLVDDIIRVRLDRRRLRLPLRAAGAVRVRRGGERGRRADALLLPLPGPRHPAAAAGGRRVRPSREMTRRLVRYPLDPETLHLAAARGRHLTPGLARRARAGPHAGRGRRRRHLLRHREPGPLPPRAGCTSASPGRFRSFPRALPVGPEDISYWPSTDLLWSLTEYPGRRFVFAMKRAQFDRAAQGAGVTGTGDELAGLGVELVALRRRAGLG